MKNRILALLHNLLLIWGAISLMIVIGSGVFVAFQYDLTNKDQIDTATIHDVQFVLNWCGLGDARIEKVVHSYVSARSLTGDHLDAYAIKISYVDAAELTTTAMVSRIGGIEAISFRLL